MVGFATLGLFAKEESFWAKQNVKGGACYELRVITPAICPEIRYSYAGFCQPVGTTHIECDRQFARYAHALTEPNPGNKDKMDISPANCPSTSRFVCVAINPTKEPVLDILGEWERHFVRGVCNGSYKDARVGGEDCTGSPPDNTVGME